LKILWEARSTPTLEIGGNLATPFVFLPKKTNSVAAAAAAAAAAAEEHQPQPTSCPYYFSKRGAVPGGTSNYIE
jgi:hypothetical protein